jgi:PAS domain S-box-containing protein
MSAYFKTQNVLEESVSLRDSGPDFRLLFANNPSPMWVYDLATLAFLEVNEAAVAKYGYSRDEFLRMRITDIRPPERIPDLLGVLGKERPALEESGEWTHLLKDGRTIHVEIASRTLTFAGKSAALVVVRDITGRKQAEDAIANYNERLRILHQIDREMIAGEGPAAIAAAALPPLRKLLGVPRAIVNLFDLATGEVEWLAAAGRHRVHVGPGVRYSIRLMGDVEALRRGEPQLIDVHALPPGPEVDALLASGVHVYLVVPMIAGEELIGALSFGGASAPFSTEQVTIAQEAAAQFAIALAQARLYERIKHQALELEVQVRERTRELLLQHESEERFRGAFEHTNVAMVLTDLDHRFVRANDAFAQLFGYSREEILNLSMADVTHPDDLAESHERRGPLLAGESQFFQMEKRYLHKDGHVIWGLVNVSLVRDTSGRPLLYVGQVQDITERKIADESLRQSEEQVRLLLNSTAEAIYGIDLQGKCTFCNPACIRMLGYADSSRLVGQDMHALMQHSRADGSSYPVNECRICQAFLKGAGTHVVDEVFWRADRTSFPVEYWSYPIRRAGQIVGAVVTFLDITERKHLEDQFRQSQKMEAIGRLAGGIAHDFNNLLTIIIGFSEMALEGLHAGDPLADQIDQIRQSGVRASLLTRQLLTFSRKQIVVPTSLDLHEIVTEMDRMLRRLIGEDIELRTSSLGPLARVQADAGQIEQVIMNLVVNARDAMPKGGRLTIETANVELDQGYADMHAGVQPGPYVLLAVSDTGCGMDEATRARIFEPFFTTKEPGKGTGLGLATVFGIVKQSGGQVEVYTEVNLGTTFKVYLPHAGEAAAASKPKSVPLTPRCGTETILLVEDEDGIRTMTRMILQNNGYQVLEASNGGEALLLCRSRKEPVHLLVTDVVMPRMSGRELAQQLARWQPGLKVLYVSGYTDDAIVHHGVLDPDTPFLQKPFTPQQLTRKVRELLDQK